MTRRFLALLAIPAFLGAAPRVTERKYEQPLKKDGEVLRRWRFARYEQPLAATLRVYADGYRLVQGIDYVFGRDQQSAYVDVKIIDAFKSRIDGEKIYAYREPSLLVADFEE